MISAKEMKKISKEYQKPAVNKQLKRIEKEIKSAAKEGEFSVKILEKIFSENIKKLQKQGFSVDPFYACCYIIKWGDK